MDLALLETFRTIAEEGSFSRAGERLLRTQPAVSLALKRLEAELGATLIDRGTKMLALTDAGRLVLEYCDRFDRLNRTLRTELGELRDVESGKLTIGANESTALYLLGALATYRERHPNVRLEIRRSLSSRIPEELLRGSLELGVISYDPADERITVREIYEDALAFVVSPNHRLARRREVAIGELGDETFIAHNVVSPYRRVVIDAFQRHHVTLNIVIELPTIETIRKLVQMNLGVTFLPRMCVRQEVEQGALCEVRVPQVKMERKIRLVHPTARRLSHAARAFLEVMAQETDRPPADGRGGAPQNRAGSPR